MIISVSTLTTGSGSSREHAPWALLDFGIRCVISTSFAEARYNEDGSENPDFVLNKTAYRDAKILVAGDNFG
ncbi:hypothetical protein ACC739_38135, partial [Rhizobium ruizarguesonis]